MGIPVAPAGLADKPLGDGPFDYATGEGQNIRVTVLTKALSYPFTLTFLPDGTMLITQRDGKLRVMRNGKLDPTPSPAARNLSPPERRDCPAPCTATWISRCIRSSRRTKHCT